MPPRTAPTSSAQYHVFAQTPHPMADDQIAWVPLGTVDAISQQGALEQALALARARLSGLPSQDGPGDVLTLTVASVAARNWSTGTAEVELKPVTTWKKATA